MKGANLTEIWQSYTFGHGVEVRFEQRALDYGALGAAPRIDRG